MNTFPSSGHRYCLWQACPCMSIPRPCVNNFVGPRKANPKSAVGNSSMDSFHYAMLRKSERAVNLMALALGTKVGLKTALRCWRGPLSAPAPGTSSTYLQARCTSIGRPIYSYWTAVVQQCGCMTLHTQLLDLAFPTQAAFGQGFS